MRTYTTDQAEKCCTGCNIFFGGEIRHIKECTFYPESLTEIYDKKDILLSQKDEMIKILREALEFYAHRMGMGGTARQALAEIDKMNKVVP